MSTHRQVRVQNKVRQPALPGVDRDRTLVRDGRRWDPDIPLQRLQFVRDETLTSGPKYRGLENLEEGLRRPQVTLCAQTLQFIPDHQTAVSELRRALKPSGRIGVSLWCELERSPYFYALVEATSTHIGRDTASGLISAFGLSDEATIERLFLGAGFDEVRVAATRIDIDLPPVREFVPRHVAATPMSAGWSAAAPGSREHALEQIESQTEGFRSDEGMRVPFWSYFATAAH